MTKRLAQEAFELEEEPEAARPQALRRVEVAQTYRGNRASVAENVGGQALYRVTRSGEVSTKRPLQIGAAGYINAQAPFYTDPSLSGVIPPHFKEAQVFFTTNLGQVNKKGLKDWNAARRMEFITGAKPQYGTANYKPVTRRDLFLMVPYTFWNSAEGQAALETFSSKRPRIFYDKGTKEYYIQTNKAGQLATRSYTLGNVARTKRASQRERRYQTEGGDQVLLTPVSQGYTNIQGVPDIGARGPYTRSGMLIQPPAAQLG
jgi:hypothetical protein